MPEENTDGEEYEPDPLEAEESCSDEEDKAAAVAADEAAADPTSLFVAALLNFQSVQEPVQVLAGARDETLCGRLLKHNDSMAHHERAKKVFVGDKEPRQAQLFDTPALQETFACVCATGGAGLSRIQIYDLHGVLCALEAWIKGATPFKDR